MKNETKYQAWAMVEELITETEKLKGYYLRSLISARDNDDMKDSTVAACAAKYVATDSSLINLRILAARMLEEL